MGIISDAMDNDAKKLAYLDAILRVIELQAVSRSIDLDYIVYNSPTATAPPNYYFRLARQPDESLADWLKRFDEMQAALSQRQAMTTPKSVEDYQALKRLKAGTPPDSYEFDHGGPYKRGRKA